MWWWGGGRVQNHARRFMTAPKIQKGYRSRKVSRFLGGGEYVLWLGGWWLWLSKEESAIPRGTPHLDGKLRSSVASGPFGPLFDESSKTHVVMLGFAFVSGLKEAGRMGYRFRFVRGGVVGWCLVSFSCNDCPIGDVYPGAELLSAVLNHGFGLHKCARGKLGRGGGGGFVGVALLFFSYSLLPHLRSCGFSIRQSSPPSFSHSQFYFFLVSREMAPGYAKG